MQRRLIRIYSQCGHTIFYLQQPYRCRVNVLTLNGRNYKVHCGSATNASQILKCVLTAENSEENFFLGLCVLIGGDFVFLPSDMKIVKVLTIK